MRLSLENSILLLLAIILTIDFFYSGVHTTLGIEGNMFVRFLTYLNFIVVITSLISIKQFFWSGRIIRISYHVFNIIFVVAFYAFSFSYVVKHEDYYVDYGYLGLSAMGVIKKFALKGDTFAIMFWICCVAVVFNLLYIVRYRRRYLRHD